MTWDERPLSFRLGRAIGFANASQDVRQLAIKQLQEVETGTRTEDELDPVLRRMIDAVPVSMRSL